MLLLAAGLGFAFFVSLIVVFVLLQRSLNGGLAVIESRLKDHSERFIQTANDRFINEELRSKASLEQSKQSIESQVGHLNKELTRIVDMVKEFEEDRIHKFVSLEEKISQASQATQGLSDAAQQLSSVIGNNQLRNWFCDIPTKFSWTF